MSRDATQIARDFARDEERRADVENQSPYSPRRGTLSIWDNLGDMTNGRAPIAQSLHVTVQPLPSGWLIAKDENGDTEIFVPYPGWYINFVPDRAGE